MREKRESGAHEEDPRVRRTRKLLQDALVELIGDQSFESITVRDIARAATVNHATFYRHYQDKYHLAQAVFTEAFDSMALALDPQTSNSKTLPILPTSRMPGHFSSSMSLTTRVSTDAVQRE